MAGGAGAQQVLRMQSVAITQKAMLDMLTTKVIRIKAIVHRVVMTTSSKSYERMTKAELTDVIIRSDKAIEEIQTTLSLTRHEVQEMRPNNEFPDEEIQAILDEAVDKITAVVMGHL